MKNQLLDAIKLIVLNEGKRISTEYLDGGKEIIHPLQASLIRFNLDENYPINLHLAEDGLSPQYNVIMNFKEGENINEMATEASNELSIPVVYDHVRRTSQRHDFRLFLHRRLPVIPKNTFLPKP